MNRADETHFNAALNQEIVMNLDWEVPATGHWDGFVVTYSPFIAMPENSEFMPPFSYGAGRTAARINLPRTDQKYTVSFLFNSHQTRKNSVLRVNSLKRRCQYTRQQHSDVHGSEIFILIHIRLVLGLSRVLVKSLVFLFKTAYFRPSTHQRQNQSFSDFNL